MFTYPGYSVPHRTPAFPIGGGRSPQRFRILPLPVRSAADRRREKRYQVDLPGTVQVNGAACLVIVSDLSASGALVSVTVPPEWAVTPDIVLVVEQFGPIDARIVHVGDGFWGLRFVNPHSHRDRLERWLLQEVSA